MVDLLGTTRVSSRFAGSSDSVQMSEQLCGNVKFTNYIMKYKRRISLRFLLEI